MAQAKRNFTVREAQWHTDSEALRAIRHEVFVVEQSVPMELEFDADDDQYHHVIAIDTDGTPIGTGRLSHDGKIGRMAVLKNARRNGVGSAILDQLIVIATANDIHDLTLSAQLHALPFYRRQGFVELGEIYREAGIVHQKMAREIQ